MVVVSSDTSRTPRRRAQLESSLSAPGRGFRRSTERKVEDPNEALVAERARQEYEELLAFEEIGFSAAAASVLVTRPSFEELYDAIEADDRQFYDQKERSLAR